MNRLVEKTTNNTRIKIGETTVGTTGGVGNNIILLRGSQSDGGHIILQNGQELLQLLNGEGSKGGSAAGKTIILQSQRIKQNHHQQQQQQAITATEASKNVKNRIIHQQTTTKPLSVDQPIDRADGVSNLSPQGCGQQLNSDTLLLQTNGLAGKRISATTLSDGSILLHPRVMGDNGSHITGSVSTAGTSSGGGGDSGPILLQTLKRFDKSIFVLRNSTTATAASPATTIKTSLSTNYQQGKGIEEQQQSISFVSMAERESVPKKVNNCVPNGGGRSKSNVVNKANNVKANGISDGGSGLVAMNGGRGNGISTRSSTGHQKQQRGANKGDSDTKKDSTGLKQSNIPLGNGKLNRSSSA